MSALQQITVNSFEESGQILVRARKEFGSRTSFLEKWKESDPERCVTRTTLAKYEKDFWQSAQLPTLMSGAKTLGINFSIRLRAQRGARQTTLGDDGRRQRIVGGLRSLAKQYEKLGMHTDGVRLLVAASLLESQVPSTRELARSLLDTK